MTDVKSSSLQKGLSSSTKKTKITPGARFGPWTVQKRGEDYISPSGVSQPRWHCKCDCGKQKLIYNSALLRGAKCSCLTNRDGRSLLKEYKIWQAMLTRTSDPVRFPDYAGRGIEVAKEWQEFERFYADMGPAPTNGSLERLYVNRGYSKENCIWVSTKSEQNFNKQLSDKSTTGVTGVSWSKVVQKWHAYINKDGKRKHLGYFDSFEAATEARQTAERMEYGFLLSERRVV